MTLLKEIGTEHLEDAVLLAFIYTDGTIIWIMIEGGEITKTIKQRPYITGGDTRPRGLVEGF